MDLITFIAEMEQLAPPELAEDFDAGKIGLIVEGKRTLKTICCALDATPAVVKKAISAHADMLVVHHTPLWTPLTSLTGATSSLMRDVLSDNLNLYVMHTNFDRASCGVNDCLADLLSLSNTEPMTLGLTGDCTLSVEEIARRIGGPVRVWGKIKKPRRLALVGGSGFDLSFMTEAKALGADAFLSAELKHSVYRSAPMPCIEATHYALEAPAMERLARNLGWKFIADPPVIAVIT
ncbi:Nif3-like dinuclear metal center hexameric protein [uncultured Methanoregula sp.]|uniref:Nif3-like dinuclear metal center hexameric protein n=1 Tax=uncultured Methanoregula sp. TaxID=1005933 RepID=UPI002AAAFF22|nr:Nif3-like dinuclear metal center hexameric protein [uncultured Methanoregula sp.]